MSHSQRQPIPYTRPNVEIVQEMPHAERIIHLGDQVQALQSMSTISIGSALRRLLFVWLRIYVNETRRGKSEKVNIKIPLPIPLLGAAFARQLSFHKAAQLASAARRGDDVSEQLDSAMGFEFIRVQEGNPERGKSTLVVIGLD